MKRPDFILGLNQEVTGESELFLGRAFELGITRISTPPGGNITRFVNRFSKKSSCKVQTQLRLSPLGSGMNEVFEKTCETLGVNELESFFFEDVEDIKNNPQSLVDLLELKKNGRLQNIGAIVSSETAILAAAKIPALQVLQVSFNLFENSLKLGSSLKKAAEAGKTLQAKAPFFEGILTEPSENLPEKFQSLAPSLKKLKDLAGRSRITMESLCLAYVLQQKIFSAVIVSAESKDQLVKNWQTYQSASRLEIKSDEIHRITQGDLQNMSVGH